MLGALCAGCPSHPRLERGCPCGARSGRCGRGRAEGSHRLRGSASGGRNHGAELGEVGWPSGRRNGAVPLGPGAPGNSSVNLSDLILDAADDEGAVTSLRQFAPKGDLLRRSACLRTGGSCCGTRGAEEIRLALVCCWVLLPFGIIQVWMQCSGGIVNSRNCWNGTGALAVAVGVSPAGLRQL